MLLQPLRQTPPDAVFFRIDAPTSGHVVLDRTLDYEKKTRLQLVLYAVEVNTTERFNTTANIIINVEDADDQYPHFVPCTPTTASPLICTNPTYSTNITDQDQVPDRAQSTPTPQALTDRDQVPDQKRVLEFSPGPIRAKDGDRGLDTPLTYSIISGADGGRFVIDYQTGEITLTRRVDRRHLMSSFRLSVMVSQIDDPMKYSVAMVLVRVLSENRFPPIFNRTTYKGFIIQSSSPATIVSTYGNEVLLIQATDQDFTDVRLRSHLPPPI
ncbi:cadherin-related family member 5 [Thalassophryne amazonica]|uniref:cadherin-related family member 5 n=1 Tax=Thalassophryne amazonica TaxID=390379 RepID=UPI001472241E|nr:cadherin-related family member 5 [Thalassophryne amazonica]